MHGKTWPEKNTMSTNIEKFERPTKLAHFDAKHMLDLTGEDVD